MEAKVVWKASQSDIALIELPEIIAPCAAVVFGRLPESIMGETLEFDMYGYPRWGWTQSEEGATVGGRHVKGTIYLSDTSPDDLLVLEALRVPSEALSESESDWKGNSGAAIVCHGLVIAVQRQHQNPKRPASLEASPLWTIYSDKLWCSLLTQHDINPEPAIVRVQKQTKEQSTKAFNPPQKPPYKLVGRTDFLRSLKAELFSGNSIALKGLPGVGKTALLLELAYEPDVQRYFNGGVLWAKLGRDADAMAILLEWITALGISQPNRNELAGITTREKTIEILKQRIQERINVDNNPFLLVIDDAWESETALALKLGSTNCTYIITTRSSLIALDFAGKSVKEINELSEDSSLELLRQISGRIVETYQEKAKLLAKAVGYLPLALILMGRYLQKESDSRSPNRIEKALKNLQKTEMRLRLEQPQVSPGTNPSLRAGTPLSLLAVIEISYEALDDEAKVAFCALSIFPPKPNSFSEEAALAVSLTPDVSLYKLYDSGLLESDESGRYRLHQTISDYSREKLIDQSVYERMAVFYAEHVESNKRNYDLIDQEYINIVASLEAANQKKMHFISIRQMKAFYPFLEARGLYEKAENILNEIKEQFGNLDQECNLTQILLNLGRVRHRLGKYSRSKEDLQRAIDLSEKCNDSETIIYSKLNLGVLEEIQGDDGEAERLYKEALILAKLNGNDEAVSIVCRTIGSLLLNSKKYLEAKGYFDDGLVSAEKNRDEQVICGILINLGWVSAISGNVEDAKEYYRKSITIVRKLKHYDFATYVRQGMGEIAKRKGDYKQAEYHYKKGLALANRIGFHERKIILLQNLSSVLTIQQKYLQADKCLREALLIASNIEHYELVDHIIKDIARLLNAQDDYQRMED
ncbi:MAG: tetratricopeptide repeat protein [Komarekiella atlantica HA4396-MV6]|nr:tetratricopeptide repeat protein [Komarekiella atlantica HA4396-MV6]